MSIRRRSGGTAAGAGLAVCLLLAVTASGAAAAERSGLTIERGDVLSVAVLEEPGLNREAKVDALGRIMLPQIGSIAVAGHGLEEIRDLIEAELSGRDIILEPSVIVEVSRYRPFYVGGAVAQEGALAYEPGLTVRHALVLAGGLERDGGGNLSVSDLLEMNAGWRAAAFALFEINSRIARLEAELEHRRESRPVAAEEVGEPEARAVAALDSALLADRLEIRTADQEHLRDLMAAVDVELDVLAQQRAHQEEESELQRRDVENARELLAKGLISQPRVRELEREELELMRGRLDVQAYTARARQNKESIGYELENSDRKWQIETRAALRDAVLERAEIKAEVDLLTANLLAAGIRLTDEATLAPPEPEVVIHRIVDGAETSLAAQMMTEVLPGDILEVSMAVPPQG